ncbi:MAG: cbb3-type cytochrome oxidase assembly protein CcoS [Cyclobacteriaceae bacterium]|nr:cbb3-type cytochrome oxidase assembly protein CcoS [Cyclobacteriaceae bacterium]MCH8514953.1 cbb3-type cytochrome oxidase assembly protein CcoS [Cyclobacteriaceae bacterium]
MEVLFILIVVSLILAGFALWLFFGAMKDGQYEDTHTPAMRILFDSAKPPEGKNKEKLNNQNKSSSTNKNQ